MHFLCQNGSDSEEDIVFSLILAEIVSYLLSFLLPEPSALVNDLLLWSFRKSLILSKVVSLENLFNSTFSELYFIGLTIS